VETCAAVVGDTGWLAAAEGTLEHAAIKDKAAKPIVAIDRSPALSPPPLPSFPALSKDVVSKRTKA